MLGESREWFQNLSSHHPQERPGWNSCLLSSKQNEPMHADLIFFFLSVPLPIKQMERYMHSNFSQRKLDSSKKRIKNITPSDTRQMKGCLGLDKLRQVLSTIWHIEPSFPLANSVCHSTHTLQCPCLWILCCIYFWIHILITMPFQLNSSRTSSIAYCVVVILNLTFKSRSRCRENLKES